MDRQPLYYNNDVFYPVPIVEDNTVETLWDQTDIQFGLRDQLAHLVARIVAGVDGVTPADVDYIIADRLREKINTDIEAFNNGKLNF